MRLRSGFTGAAVVALAALLSTGGSPGAQPSTFAEGAAAGDVTTDGAIIWTRTRSPADIRVEYSTDPGFRGARTSSPVPTGPESDYTTRIPLYGLATGQRYSYRVVLPAEQGPAGTFVTAPPADRETPLVVVWGADTAEDFRPFRVFRAMQDRTPDLFLYLGDTIYADQGAMRAATLEEYRQKYRANREDSHLRAFLASASSWVVWDDHEVANNFDSDHRRLPIGLRAFLEYWPVRIPPMQPGRLYRNIRWGRTAEIFVLDTRQYRSPERWRDGPGKTMLGPAQKQWLLDGLRRSDALVKIVASSVVLRYHGADSWEGYAYERDEILRLIRDQRIPGVIFLSADVHYAAWLRHPEGVYEAIAGPLAAVPARTARASDRPGTLWASAGRFNYGWMRVASDGISLEWRDEQDVLLYQARLPIAR